ncbi:MAG TPA: hypothetical protein VIQ48_09300 [Rhodanobacter sp.]
MRLGPHDGLLRFVTPRRVNARGLVLQSAGSEFAVQVSGGVDLKAIAERMV